MTTTLLVFVGGAANADEPSVGAQAISAIAAVAPHVLSSTQAVPPTSSKDTTLSLGGSDEPVTVPADAQDGVTLGGVAQTKLIVGLPNASQASTADTAQGVATYDNNNGSSTTLVVKTDGSVQIATVIQDRNAPTLYEYSLGTPEGIELKPGPDGGVVVSDPTGQPIAAISAPWAKDATGANVPTRFRIQGTSLVQEVDHIGYAYPIIADPQILYFWWGQAVKFTKAETKSIGNATSDAGAVAIVCGLLPAALAVACGAASWLAVAYWIGPFRRAAAHGNCGQLNQPYVGVIIGGPLTWQSYEVSC
ncbi:hypothetical protein [Luethyella okanaganae]|uniref:Uncharacterized protein n=1 Tax=Luethyella okanaganae TaxID=69372 RepID=A0ABW1VL10_9MICO